MVVSKHYTLGFRESVRVGLDNLCIDSEDSFKLGLSEPSIRMTEKELIDYCHGAFSALNTLIVCESIRYYKEYSNAIQKDENSAKIRLLAEKASRASNKMVTMLLLTGSGTDVLDAFTQMALSTFREKELLDDAR